MQRMRDSVVLNSKWAIYITAIPPRLRDHWGRESGKILRARNSKHLQWNICWALTVRWFLTPTTLFQFPTSHIWNPSGCDYLPKTLCAADDCKGQKSQFSRIWSQKSCPCSRRWLETQAYSNNIKWVKWVLKENTWSRKGKGLGGGIGRESWLKYITYMYEYENIK